MDLISTDHRAPLSGKISIGLGIAAIVLCLLLPLTSSLSAEANLFFLTLTRFGNGSAYAGPQGMSIIIYWSLFVLMTLFGFVASIMCLMKPNRDTSQGAAGLFLNGTFLLYVGVMLFLIPSKVSGRATEKTIVRTDNLSVGFPILTSNPMAIPNNIRNLRRVQIGMSKSQVLEIMGEPYVQEGHVLIYVTSFDVNPSGADKTRISFDNGEVVSVEPRRF